MTPDRAAELVAAIDDRARELTVEHEARKLAAIPVRGLPERIGDLVVAGLGVVLGSTVLGVVGLIGFWIVRGFGRFVGAW
jgi:hypothetical protein